MNTIGGLWIRGRFGKSGGGQRALRWCGLVIFCMGVWLAGSGGVQGATLSVGSTSALAGETIAVPVSYATEGAATATIQFDLTYTAEWFEITAVIGDAAEAAGMNLTAVQFGPGVLRAAFSGTGAAVLGDGPILVLQIRVSDETPEGAHSLGLANLVASGPQGTPVAISLLGGVVQVGASPDRVARLTFAQFADGMIAGEVNRTRVILRNPSSEPDAGEVRFWDPSGDPLSVDVEGVSASRHGFAIPGWGTWELTTSGSGELKTGAVDVVSDLGEASRIEGAEVFDILGSYVSVGDSPPREHHQVFVSYNSRESTGIAVYNPDRAESARLRLHLLNSNGGWEASNQLELGPGERIAHFVNEPEMFGDLIGTLQEFRGTLNILVEGDGEVSVLGLLQRLPSGALIAVPVGNRSWDDAGPVAGPQVVITSPVEGQGVTGGTVTVTGTASAGAAAVTAVAVRVNGGEWLTVMGTTSWSITVDLSAGVNTIEARAVDQSGYFSEISSLTVTWNPPTATGPSVAITSPTPGQEVTAQSVTVSGTASPGSSDLKRVWVRVNSGGAWQQAAGTTYWSRIVSLRLGANTIEARAEDQAGKFSTVVSVSVDYVDVMPPTVTIESPTAGQVFNSGTATVSGTAADTGSGVGEVLVRINGGLWQVATGTASWSRGVTLAIGVNTIEVRAEDKAGNGSAVQSVTVTRVQLVPPGSLVATDPLLGNLRHVPAGTFTQGAPPTEPCQLNDETRFPHTISKNLAVMETEVTRQMWADLKLAQPTLPAEPTATAYGAGMGNPVQRVTWYEAVLFANLMSVERGLTRAYYVDAGLTQPLTASNHQTDNVYVNWNVDGYRLPTEGEWEYFTRAGSAGPFWIDEPNYAPVNCGLASQPGTFPQLEKAAWFWANSEVWLTSSLAGAKLGNSWGLKDVHGNVWEWVWDRYGTYPGGAWTDYRGPAGGATRILRGGSWYDEARDLRSAYRSFDTPAGRYANIGFRLLRPVP